MATILPLSGALLADRDVLDFQISPDGLHAVYRADAQTNDAFELYRVTLDAGVPTRLSGLLPADTAVSQYTITPDGETVVYIAPQDDPDVPELYAVPIAGMASDSIKLNGDLDGGEVLAFQVSEDNTAVAFLASDGQTGTVNLYGVPLDAAAPATPLNGPLPNGGNVIEFQLAVVADEVMVVYLADQFVNNTFELYAIPIDGPTGAAVQLNDPLITNGNVVEFVLNANGDVVYRANQENEQVYELYATTLDRFPSGAAKLNGPLTLGGDVLDYKLSPDGTRVVYRADEIVNDRFEIFSVSINGPATSRIKLNGSLTPVNGQVLTYAISPNNSRVVYRATQQTAGVIELYSVPLFGPSAAGVKLNDTLMENGSVSDFQISPDSTRVVYLADQQTVFMDELYSVDLYFPAGSTKLNGFLTNNGDVLHYAISANNKWVYYLADQAVDGLQELFRAPISASFQSIRLNQPLSGERDVVNFMVPVDSGRVVYQADQQVAGKFELFIADDDQIAVGFVTDTVQLDESAGAVAIAVPLSSSAVLPVTVHVEIVGDTAVPSQDYIGVSQQLSYTPGTETVHIPITIIDNDVVNEDKTIIFQLSNPINAVLGPYDQVIVTIRNDDYFIYAPLVSRP
ncbi:MAG: hypothetical protein IPJ90_23845 [Anaerolineaceae bacterium]|nr:hypothetical protein [Anaerolineaceae bacterium]